MAAANVEKRVEIAYLADFYGPLLTEKQREVLSLYCEEDLSLSEIAQEAGISRQAVHDQLTRAEQRLGELEEKLGMAKRFSRVAQGLQECRALLGRKAYDQADTLLQELIRLEQEETNGL